MSTSFSFDVILLLSCGSFSMLCIRSIEVIAASASEKELVKKANVMEIAEV